MPDQAVPELLEVCKERLTKVVTVGVGAMTRVIAAAGEQIPWQWWNYDTVDIFLGCQNWPHTFDSFFENVGRTDDDFTSQVVFALA
jgi:hypothetical protein